MLFIAERHGPAGQGYCQGGFSADFTKVREILAGGISNHKVSISQWRFDCVHSISRICLNATVTCTLLSSVNCCVLQNGRVVLGGPGSFYWQGELARMWNSVGFVGVFP